VGHVPLARSATTVVPVSSFPSRRSSSGSSGRERTADEAILGVHIGSYSVRAKDPDIVAHGARWWSGQRADALCAREEDHRLCAGLRLHISRTLEARPEGSSHETGVDRFGTAISAIHLSATR